MKKTMKKVVTISIAVLLFIIICILTAIPILIINPIVNSRADFKTIPIENSKKLILKTQDEINIASWMIESTNPKGIIILLSGIQNPSVTAFSGYARMLKDNGYSSLLIEMRSHGESEGNKISFGMEEWIDVKAGVDYIKSIEEYKNLPIIVWGTSMGGATAINSAGKIPEIDGVISFSAYSSFADTFCDILTTIGIPKFISNIEKPFINLYIGFKFGFDKLKVSPINQIENLNGRPILLMHSKEDSQVPFNSFERLKQKTKEPVITYKIDGDEHFIYSSEYFNNPERDIEITQIILNFLNQYFE